MKQFARNLLVVLMASALVLISGCSIGDGKSESEQQSAKTLYDHGLEVVSLLGEMAQSDQYVSLLSGSTEIRSILKEASQGNFSQPKAVYRISIPESAALSLMEMDISGLSKTLQENIKSKVSSMIFSQINAMGGATTLAASSVCTAGKTFVSSELEEDQIYLYTYADAVPATVTFIKGEDGTVSATGTLLLYEDFQADPAASVRNLLGEFGVTVEAVTQ